MTRVPRTPVVLTDPDDERLQPFRDVAEPVRLAEAGLFVAEGRTLVETLLRSPRFAPGVTGVLVTRAAYAALEGALGGLPRDVPAWVVDGPAVFKHLTGYRFHQGCLALARRPTAVRLDDLQAALAPGPCLVVGLEGVTDPDNVGTIFRTAAAFGAAAVVLSRGSADPLYRKALRTSMGTVLHLPFAVLDDWDAGLERLRREGYRLLALTPRGDATRLDAVAEGGRNLLLLGSEERGLSAGTFARADLLVRIPMAAAVDSLNVAASAAIACHRLRGPDARS